MSRPSVATVLVANSLLRTANSAGGALVGFYLGHLARTGEETGAGLVGLLAAINGGSELLASVPLGILADKVRASTLLFIGCLIGGVATALFGITGLVGVFFVSRALEGLASAAGGPPLLAFLTDATAGEPPYRSRVMSYYELSLLGGLALGGLAGGLAWEFAERRSFTFIGAVYLLAGLLFALGTIATPRPIVSAPTPWKAIMQAGRDAAFVRLLPPWLAVTAMVGMWLSQVPFQLSGPQVAGQYLVGRFTSTETGLIMLAYAIVFGAGLLFWGFALARIPRPKVMRLAVAAIIPASLCIYLLNSSGAWPDWLRVLVLVVLSVLIVVESGFTPAALSVLADIAGASGGRGTVMGSYSLVLGLGVVIGSVAGAALAEWASLNGLLAGTGALAAIAVASLFAAKREVTQ